MLKVNGIDAYYGDVCALHDISLEIGDDEIISIITVGCPAAFSYMLRDKN